MGTGGMMGTGGFGGMGTGGTGGTGGMGSTSASTTAASSSSTGINCDNDGDGVLRDDAQCGGTDCDDDDARAKPGQMSYFDTPRASGGYDFNCDNVDEPKMPTSCTCPGNVLQVPAGGAGCGVMGNIKTCTKPLLGACGPDTFVNTATQSCR
jgi:hypothetical protein